MADTAAQMTSIRQITKDEVYDAVAPTDFGAMLEIDEHIALAVTSDEVTPKFAAMGTTPLSSPTIQSFEQLISQDLGWLTEAVKAADLQMN